MKLKGKRNCYFPKYAFKKLNNLLISGYFKPIKTCCDDFWGIAAFETPDHNIQVRRLEGRFLGGGIVESYGYRVKLGNNEFWCASWIYALKSVYQYMKVSELI